MSENTSQIPTEGEQVNSQAPTPTQEQTTSQQPSLEMLKQLYDALKLYRPKVLKYERDGYRTTIPGFQIRGQYGIYKFIVYTRHWYLKPINCSPWGSEYTFEYCMARNEGKWTQVRGLWFVNINFRTLQIKSNRKLWTKSSVSLEYTPDWATLIKIDAYGYTIFEEAVKAPTILLRTVATQGHLEVFDFSQYVSYYHDLFWYGPREELLKQVEIYNHVVRFEKDIVLVKNDEAIDYNGLSVLILVPEAMKMTLESPDHRIQELLMQPGAYIFAHRPPRRAVD